MVEIIVNESVKESLIAFGAIQFGEFTLASGAKSTYYINIKDAATQPGLLTAIGSAIADLGPYDCIAGVAVGAVPIAVAASLASGIPYAIIRKGEKGYGVGGTIIGDVKGKHVLLVEDVTTSGGSVMYGITALREAGAVVDTVVTVVDREQGASERLTEAGITLVPLVRVSDLLPQ
ncbi:orotate phosphoribosyltransferase [Methanogenium organophilum]|uniref:Orotate phosphoribosyltransferase n=1 Tax=Methanogenium organophilum TaxID=2199 RepID=A0A9X9S3N1_METOG|nr:orotate phosphoribosyltransferase [Methanogenium organophilum]WAI00900.1 orotate phosphoribosyltransferase [Methanogenium organophilum]